MSDSKEQVSTEQKAPVSTRKPKIVRKDSDLFTMNFWEDEKAARKFIKENLLFIAQKAKGEDRKAHFSRVKDNGDGTQTMSVEFPTTYEVTLKDGSKELHEEYAEKDFIRVTFDPSRKFPRSDKDDEDSKKKGELPVFVKWHP